MGKSRRHKHVDRNAHRNVGPGRSAPPRPAKGADRRANVALTASVATLAVHPQPAIPLATEFEALGLASGSRSRYPAKKAKRARLDLSVPRPTVPVVVAPEPALKAAEETTAPRAETERPAPILLIAYQPQAPRPEVKFDEAIASGEAPDLLEPVLWAEDIYVAPAPKPVFDTPTPAMVQAAETPLPRRAAVTPWRKTGPLDAIARWIRTRAWQLAVKIAPKTPRKATEVARLRAENAALRRQLLALQQVAA